MQNKYNTSCHKCGNHCNPGEASIRKAGRRRWIATCNHCNGLVAPDKPLSAMDAIELANGDESQAAGIYAAQKSGGKEYQSWGAYFPGSGQYIYQNKAGRCEDAPCCGCCS